MSASFMSSEGKAKREADLERMRERWNSRSAIKKQRSRVNSANASGPHPWARGPLSNMIEAMKPGESVWLARKSPAVHRAAKTARRKIVTRTVFKDGTKGVRITVK